MANGNYEPFDCAAAKPGGKAIHTIDKHPLTFLGGPDYEECFVFLGEGRVYEVHQADAVSKPPLTYVEGKPVYAGDKLWCQHQATPIEVENITKVNGKMCVTSAPWGRYPIDTLSWTEPKRMVKRSGWINLYHSSIYDTKEKAQSMANSSCVGQLFVEWDEPA